MSLQSSLSTEINLLDDSDEEKEAKKDLLLACELVGLENISQKERKGKHFTKGKEFSGKNTSKSWL